VIDFEGFISSLGGTFLKIDKHERESDIMRVLYKWHWRDRKFRLMSHVDDETFSFWATKKDSRYFHPVRIFKTLEDAMDYCTSYNEKDLPR
jgi:hypothetical protein